MNISKRHTHRIKIEAALQAVSALAGFRRVVLFASIALCSTIFGLSVEASGVRDQRVEREVKREVQQRIKSYLDHVEKRVEAEEERRQAQREFKSVTADQDEQREKARLQYLKTAPTWDERVARLESLRAKDEVLRERDREKRRQLQQIHADREQALKEARKKYDFLDPAIEYGLIE